MIESLLDMLLSRFGSILAYQDNVLLVVGLVLALFVVYRAAKEKDYNVERVMDWVIWGVAAGMASIWLVGKVAALNFQSPNYLITQLPFVKLAGVFDLRLEFGLLVFVLYTFFLFRRWRWPLFPPLDFAALGNSFFLILAAPILKLPNLLTCVWQEDYSLLAARYSLPLFWASFAYHAAAFFLLSLIYKKHYRKERIFFLFFVLTLRPFLMLTGAIFLGILERGRLRQTCLLKRQGFVNFHLNMVRVISKVISRVTRRKTAEELEQERKDLERRLQDLEENQDPRGRPERVLENAPEEDAEEAEVGLRVGAIKRILVGRLRDVRNALGKLKRGSYGVCDRCGAKIDPARLKAKPDARYCLKCTRELEKERQA